MSEDLTSTNIKKLEFRAKVPKVIRMLAIGGFGITLIVIMVGFYLKFGQEDFRMKGLKELQLSKDVIAEFSSYERRENDGEKLNYYVKADRVKTFSDNHQELENIHLQVFDATGETFDKITANKAIYIPDKENPKSFTAFFSGDVVINSRDRLEVKTDQLSYKKSSEIAEAEEYIEFSRENVKGSALGAVVNTNLKTIELLRDVKISTSGAEGELESIEYASITAGRAFFDQPKEQIDFSDKVDISILPNQKSGSNLQPTDIAASKATAVFTSKEIERIDLEGNVYVYQKPTANNPGWSKTRANRASAKLDKEVKRIELFDDVDIQTTANKTKPTKVKTAYALYEKDLDRFEMKRGVEIWTLEDDQSTVIRAENAIFEQRNGKIILSGNAEIVQPNDYIRGDLLTAYLLANKKVKSANVKGAAYLKQNSPERTTEVSADELNAVFDDQQRLLTANTSGVSTATMIPSASETYTRVSLSAPIAIKLGFLAGLMNTMQTDGRTTISLESPNNEPDASNKKVTADTVKTTWNSNGKDLVAAQAVGNAELLILPLRSSADNYKTTVYAPRFDCDFFEGNNAKSCIASTNVKTVRIPTVTRENRGDQTITSGRMEAVFSKQTKDLERLEAAGNAKFTELDRNGIADRISFTQADQTVRLRGGEPTFWDSRARLKGNEVDWDTKNQRSYFRGKVYTTYYSQKKSGGATPFQSVDSPVFITAEKAEIDHTTEIAIYSGLARAWQENNYVRADKLTLNQKDGKLNGDGSVQSLLYDARRKENGKEVTVPVYAASDRLSYLQDKNYLKYEGNVDIRQQTDRITAGVANIYLNDKNEVSLTVLENNVVITQPDRKAKAEYAKYDNIEETVVLNGNPATVEDRENGSSQAAKITFFMRDNRVLAESKTPENNSGRIRSVYKVKN